MAIHTSGKEKKASEAFQYQGTLSPICDTLMDHPTPSDTG